MTTEKPLFSDNETRFLDRHRVARLATAGKDGQPHLVPVCFGRQGASIYIAIDEKPKRRPLSLKRLRNIAENPFSALLVDRYEEDWSRLGWVMLRGRAEILFAGAEHESAQALLRARYAQLEAMRLEGLPVIALRVEKVASWGNLEAD